MASSSVEKMFSEWSNATLKLLDHLEDLESEAQTEWDDLDPDDASREDQRAAEAKVEEIQSLGSDIVELKDKIETFLGIDTAGE